MTMEETVKFFFGHSNDMIEDEDRRNKMEKIFLSKKQKKSNPKAETDYKDRRKVEEKLKNLHMKFTTKPSQWTQFLRLFKTDQGSLWFYDYMLQKMNKEKERASNEKRRQQQKKINEEMLINQQIDITRNFDKIKMHKRRDSDSDDC